MKAIDMEIHTPYVCTKGSSDGTVGVGQTMWLSANGQLNFLTSDGGGCLLESEWKSSKTVDFEVERSTEWQFCLFNHSECLVRAVSVEPQ